MVLLALAGCILGQRPATCDADADCREAFGFGSSCAKSGYCSVLEPNPRCEETYPEDLYNRPEKYADAFVIGSIFQEEFDQPQLQSIQLAVTQIADEGWVDGREVAVVFCDNDNKLEYEDDLDLVEGAVAVAEHMVEDLGIDVIIGPATSDGSKATYEAVSSLDALLISPSATSPTLTLIDGASHSDEDPGLFWRTVPPDDLQGFAIARDILNRGVPKTLFIYQDSSYASLLSETAKEIYVDAGNTAEVVVFQSANERDEAIGSAAASDANEVVFVSSEVEDVVSFLNGAAGQLSSFENKGIFLADGAADPFMLQNVSAEVVNELFPKIRGTRPQVPSGDVYSAFTSSYRANFNDNPEDAVFAPYTYDATFLALLGGAWASSQGEEGGEAIARGLRKLSDGPAIKIGTGQWQDAVTSLSQGDSINVEGASGSLDYDPVTGEVNNPVEVWVIANNTFVPRHLCYSNGSCEDVVSTTTSTSTTTTETGDTGGI